MLDTGRFISELDPKLPTNQDSIGEAAAQMRNIKQALQNTFPHLDGEDVNRPNLPIGFIAMYSGTEDNLTPGWTICNGTSANGVVVPDLRGKFIMGATDEEPTQTTGSSNVKTFETDSFTLATANLPPIKFNYDGYSSIKMADGGGPNNVPYAPVTKTTNTIGSGTAFKLKVTDFDNRPAYYALAYIMFVGMPAL